MDAHLKKIWKESFKGFYEKHCRSLWHYIFKICGDESAADDVFQEAFYRFLRAEPIRLNEYQQKAYLYKVAFRLTMDHFRRLKVEHRQAAHRERPDIPNPDLSLSLDMERTFRLLKPKESTLLWLAYVEGYSHREISDIMVLKEKSVKVLLARVRGKFAGILRSQGYGEASIPNREGKK